MAGSYRHPTMPTPPPAPSLRAAPPTAIPHVDLHLNFNNNNASIPSAERRRAMSSLATATLRKICATCGRQITWRKKWEKNWESITYCSDSCRKHKIKPHSLDTAFESRILALLSERKRTAGEAAVVTCEEAEADVLSELKSLHKTQANNEEADPDDSLTVNRQEPKPSKTRERCRQAARRLAARGAILVTQQGKTIDPSFAKGVMELKLP